MTRFGFLSTYPPTRCGLATFSHALAVALTRDETDAAAVVRVLDAPEPRPPVELDEHVRVRTDLIAGDVLSITRAILALNGCDVVIVQHEYGIYGGADGDEVLDVLAAVTAPAIVVLHTVLVEPTPRQRLILISVCRLAARVVVMTANARDLLASHYDIDPSHVDVIPHGVTQLAAPDDGIHRGRRVLTWGLISPGKGIEWGIRAMAELADLTPPVEYVVAGQTHPKVLAHAGEGYRTMLTDLVTELGLASSVRLDGRYLDIPQLAALVASSDVVLLPYDSRDQVTSGVLVEAVAAGLPVVATGFPHATELLSGGAGIIVAHEDPQSIAAALRTVLTEDAVSTDMRQAAARTADDTTWDAVAERYRVIATRLLASRAA